MIFFSLHTLFVTTGGIQLTFQMFGCIQSRQDLFTVWDTFPHPRSKLAAYIVYIVHIVCMQCIHYILHFVNRLYSTDPPVSVILHVIFLCILPCLFPGLHILDFRRLFPYQMKTILQQFQQWEKSSHQQICTDVLVH